MLRTRLLVGSLLAALVFGILVADSFLAPWFPILYLLFVALAALGGEELRRMLPDKSRPPALLCHAGLQAIVAVNWVRPLHQQFPAFVIWADPWQLLLAAVALFSILAFLHEMWVYNESGDAVGRVAFSIFAWVYLGVLSSFLAQVRWLPSSSGWSRHSAVALALTIFVPKCCDIGAYLTGRALGRRPMTPRLSPKKTWEGAAGGIALAILVAIAGSWFGERPAWFCLKAIGFGLTVAIAGMLGDLAESLLKRDSQKKDASQAIPGFGGVLDVVDSLLFAAPVAYLWLQSREFSPLG
ncbi:MAG TPA: phosphatidate cytidylyltransferase [Gemmataceae bacterium]|jgi:phosphatidate cytidylyltransferase|nr:phosphatidate cytidylyltransferase [Gemmataceae bacterium]